jgi:hypothetical protein
LTPVEKAPDRRHAEAMALLLQRLPKLRQRRVRLFSERRWDRFDLCLDRRRSVISAQQLRPQIAGGLDLRDPPDRARNPNSKMFRRPTARLSVLNRCNRLFGKMREKGFSHFPGLPRRLQGSIRFPLICESPDSIVSDTDLVLIVLRLE